MTYLLCYYDDSRLYHRLKGFESASHAFAHATEILGLKWFYIGPDYNTFEK